MEEKTKNVKMDKGVIINITENNKVEIRANNMNDAQLLDVLDKAKNIALMTVVNNQVKKTINMASNMATNIPKMN